MADWYSLISFTDLPWPIILGLHDEVPNFLFCPPSTHPGIGYYDWRIVILGIGMFTVAPGDTTAPNPIWVRFRC